MRSTFNFMSKIGFYFDEMARRAVSEQLIAKGYEAVMAVDIGMTEKPDETHLAEATKRNLVMITLDKPFASRASAQSEHAGLICWTKNTQDVGAMLRVLIRFAIENTPENVAGKVFWLKE